MFFMSHWARELLDPTEMISEIVKRNVSPFHAAPLLVQVAKSGCVGELKALLDTQLDERYWDSLLNFVAFFKDDSDFSGDDFEFASFVHNGRLTSDFVAGLQAIRSYVPASTFDEYVRECQRLYDEWQARKKAGIDRPYVKEIRERMKRYSEQRNHIEDDETK